MMKKKSVLMMLCALMSVMSIAGLAACDFGGKESESQSSVSESSEISESSESSEESVSSESSESSEESVSSESSESSEESESSSEEETPNEEALTIVAPLGEVFPYVDEAKAFLQAGEGADVIDYYEKMDNPQAPIQIKWQYDAEGARKFLVEYATKADYSDAITLEMGAAKRSVEVYNLYKGTNYYLRITALDAKGGVLHQEESEFQTTALGPRVMNIEGICNVRDLGGYETSFGKTIVQGIAYRGGALKDKNSTLANGDKLELTENGKKYMSEVLGIKGELDFRDANESGIKLEDGSLIPGATLTYVTAGGYEDIFTSSAANFRNVFAYLADKNNYPLYYHCTAGADRTGSVTYLLYAFLGVSELECHQNFAFTSFSIYGLRASQSTDSGNSARYRNMVNMLKEYRGDTFQEKAENRLLDMGVTQEELDNIKGIFFGEIPIGETNTDVAEELPVATVAEGKTLNENLTDAIAGWTMQKKEY